jgi:hypothetical protein
VGEREKKKIQFKLFIPAEIYGDYLEFYRFLFPSLPLEAKHFHPSRSFFSVQICHKVHEYMNSVRMVIEVRRVTQCNEWRYRAFCRGKKVATSLFIESPVSQTCRTVFPPLKSMQKEEEEEEEKLFHLKQA